MTAEQKIWSEIKNLSKDLEIEIQITFKKDGLIRVVIDDKHSVHSFIQGWDNIILNNIKSICQSIKFAQEKKEKELNIKLKQIGDDKINFPDDLFKK